MTRKASDTSVDELMQSIGLLVRRVRAAAAPGLSMTEAAVLARLDREGPATAAELARAEAMKPQSMGATVTVLEELGLVERKAHPTDGRQLNILLTAKGAAVRGTARGVKLAWLTQAIAQLDETDRDALFKATGIIRKLVNP